MLIKNWPYPQSAARIPRDIILDVLQGMMNTKMITLDQYVENNLGIEVLKKLNHQSTGGDNNAKGNNHESYFAIFKLAKSYNEQSEDDVEISSQDKAFVDDLVVHNLSTNSKISYQLKDAKSVYWYKKKGITPYFQHQYKVDKEFHKLTDSETVLVLAQKNVYNLRNDDIPTSIASHSRCLYFENLDSPNKMLLNNSEFKLSIGKLCVKPDDIDKLEIIVGFLLGAWSAHSKVERKVSKLLELAKRGVQPDFFKSDGGTMKLDTEVALIVDKIDGIEYTIEDGYLNYRCGGFEGIVRYKVGTKEFSAICEEIIKQHPTQALELFKVFMGTGDRS